MNDQMPSTFGELLKIFRKRSRLTQLQLATAMGMHLNTIGGWERGDGLPGHRGVVLELGKRLRLNEAEGRQFLEASLTALAPYWSVPIRRNPLFTGREEILETLYAGLSADQQPTDIQSYAIHGLAGIGKTHVAVEYAYRYALEYNAIFWIAAENEETLLTSFLAVADLLQLPERQEANLQQMVASVHRWLGSHSKWLLIWDNLEEMELLTRYLPSTLQGAVLITTRRQGLGTLVQDLKLSLMNSEEGTLLLLRRAKMLALDATRDQMKDLVVSQPNEYSATQDIVTALGGLPLALDQAGAYIEATQCSVLDYQHLLQSSQLRLLDEYDVPNGHPLSVMKTFSLIFEQVEKNHLLAVEVLRVCAFLAPEAIPEELFLQGASSLGPAFEVFATDPFQFHSVVKTLLRYSLIQRHPTLHTLSIHRLVQVVLRERMSQQDYQQWQQRVLSSLHATFPEVQYETWKVCERFLPHVLACLAGISDQVPDRKVADVLQKVATYLDMRAQYKEAEPFYERALRIQEQALGPEHPDIAKALDGLANLYWHRGKYEEAERCCERALRIQEQALGPEHLDIAKALNGLAILYMHDGKYEEAEALYERALHIREQGLGPSHPLVAKVLNNLAILCMEQRKFEEAEPLYERALYITELALGAGHPEVALVINNIGDLYREWGRYEKAEPLYGRALQIAEQAWGPDHPDVALMLNNLADLYRECAQYERAERFYERALRIYEPTLGREHPDVATALHNLAICSQKQSHLPEAVALSERALSIRSQAFGESHPETVATQGLAAQLILQHERTEKEVASQQSTEEIG